ncbi:MAG: hypothetical protein ACP5L5_10895 [Vulcanisaeta sp.]
MINDWWYYAIFDSQYSIIAVTMAWIALIVIAVIRPYLTKGRSRDQ